jgi:heat shock protein HtpX
MGIPTPEPSPNAFAMGRNPNHASVAVTAGILRLMNDEELAAVLAHALGHVKNRDILINSIAAALASAITDLAQMAMWFGAGRRAGEQRSQSPLGGLLMLLLAPMAGLDPHGNLANAGVQRGRHVGADARQCAADDRRAGEAGFDRPADSARRIFFDVALVYHAAVLRQIPLQAVLHSSPIIAERISALCRVPVNG